MGFMKVGRTNQQHQHRRAPIRQAWNWLEKRPLLGALLLALFALAVRLLYLFSLRGDPWLLHPIVDETAYLRLARALFTAPNEAFPLFRPPLWPALLGILDRLGLTDPFILVRVFNAIAGSLIASVTYAVGRRLFGHTAGFIAGLIVALAGVLVHLHTTGLATPLFGLCLLLALHESSKLLEDRDASRRNQIKAGLFWGLALLARPIAVPVWLLTVLWLATRRSRNSGAEEGARRFAPTLVLLFVPMLLVFPVTVLNIAHGDVAFISTNGGVNLYLGNHPGADGVSPVHPALGPGWAAAETEAWASRQAGKHLSPSQASAWYAHEAIGFWLQNSKEALLLFAKKTALVFGGTETSNNGDWQYFAGSRPLLALLMGVGAFWIWPLGLMSMFQFWRSEPKSRYWSVITLVFLLSVALFFVTSRFRAPVLPVMALFAAGGIVELLRGRWSRRTKVWYAIMAALLLAGLNVIPASLAPPANTAYGHLIYARLHERAGNPALALEFYRRALLENPTTPLANEAIGDALYQRGRYHQALEAYRSELAIKPRHETYRAMGLAYRELGQPAKAAAAMKQASHLAPRNAELRRMYAELLGEQALMRMEQQEFLMARTLFDSAAVVSPENPFFPFGSAASRWASGDTARAQRMMDSLDEKHPDFPPLQQWREGWRPAQ